MCDKHRVLVAFLVLRREICMLLSWDSNPPRPAAVSGFKPSKTCRSLEYVRTSRRLSMPSGNRLLGIV